MIETPAPAASNGTPLAVQPDPQETREWLDALDGVIDSEGAGRASELVRALVERAATRGVRTPAAQTTPYVNTIAVAAIAGSILAGCAVAAAASM